MLSESLISWIRQRTYWKQEKRGRGNLVWFFSLYTHTEIFYICWWDWDFKLNNDHFSLRHLKGTKSSSWSLLSKKLLITVVKEITNKWKWDSLLPNMFASDHWKDWSCTHNQMNRGHSIDGMDKNWPTIICKLSVFTPQRKGEKAPKLPCLEVYKEATRGCLAMGKGTAGNPCPVWPAQWGGSGILQVKGGRKQLCRKSQGYNTGNNT